MLDPAADPPKLLELSPPYWPRSKPISDALAIAIGALVGLTGTVAYVALWCLP